MNARGIIFAGALAIFAGHCRAQVTVTIDAAGTPTPVARGFAGFSEETSGAEAWTGIYIPGLPALFDSALVNLLTLLGSYEGPPVIRIGGNSQDRYWLNDSIAAIAPPFQYATAPTLTKVSTTAVYGSAWVQRLTGCPFSIGLNLGGNLPSEAVTEMAAYQREFDPGGILAFDIGNEPDAGNFESYRTDWGPGPYQENLVEFLTALQNASPGTAFAAPAYFTTNWLPPDDPSDFNSLLSAVNGQISFVTAHEYVGSGDPDYIGLGFDPVADLFDPANSSAIAANFTATLGAAATYGLGLRINETNTFTTGVAGVSNAMASALWAADVLGSYAQAGVLGVNFHGSSSAIYSPLTATSGGSAFSVTANPLFYGMMLFAQFIQNGAGLVAVTTGGALPDTASVYASRDGSGALRVLLINKSQTDPLTAAVSFANLGGAYQAVGNLILLTAPSISATTGLSLGGQSYDPGGNVVGALAPTPVAGSGGTFSCQVPAGSAGLFTLDLQSPVAPTATAQAVVGEVFAGNPATFTSTAAGTAPFTYQWLFNGTAIPGATSYQYVIPSVQPGNAGQYSVTVTNSAGSVTSASVALGVQIVQGSRLMNLSTRANVGTGGNILIVGFGIQGTGTKSVLLRGVGPSLATAPFNLPGTLAQPALTLLSSDGRTLLGNTVWAGNSVLANAFAQVGAFALPATSADSATTTIFLAGSYTCEISGVNSGTGVALAEIYDQDTRTPSPILVNCSGRGEVGTGANMMIAGFVIAGNQPLQVLLRGVGPTLSAAPFNVPGALPSSSVGLYDSNSVLIASDTGWGNALGAGSSAVNATVRQATASDMAAAGAFPLPQGSSDSAMVATLPPGGYSLELSGTNNATGVGLVEVYVMP